MKLDTVCMVETPEGIDLHADIVGLVPRALAYTLDLLIRASFIFVLAMLLLFFAYGNTSLGILLVVYFLIEWWYPVVFEVYRNGQTIGKKVFSIKVVNDDLTPIRLGPSLLRNLLRTADFFPFFYAVGIITMLVSPRFQRLGDLAANTLVIYQQEKSSDANDLSGVAPVVPAMRISEQQQVAFINFALNRGHLSEARQQEIAEIIRPTMSNYSGGASDYVRGVGKWLLGAK